jgi:serine/threonine protein phosphatase PrpC
VRIPACERPCSAVWHHWDRDRWTHGLLVIGVWTEQKARLGEDAEPLLAHHRPSGRGLIAVFDGAGGAGSASAGRTSAGVERTGAWVSSRVARAATEEWFVDAVEQHRLDAQDLHRTVVRCLDYVRSPVRCKISGTMRRELPTTIAALTYRITPGRVVWHTLWAGDSRCFVLDPGGGLQQVSRDDAEEGDALILLTEDPPMTNMVSANREFWINLEKGEISTPCVLLCATDGFFGYVHTPAEFEHVLLSTLMTATDAGHWGDLLAETVRSYTGDDTSLALVAIGFRDFDDLRDRFTARARHLSREHWAPMQRAAGSDRDELVAARTASWNRYRRSYERRMPKPTAGGLR